MIRLDAEFDSGSLDIVRSRIDGEVVHLVGREDFYPGCWKWLNFRVYGVHHRQPIFTISDAFAEGEDRLDRHAMVFSEDGQTWHPFAQHTRSDGHYTFTYDRPFESDSVQIAFGIPYPVAHCRAWIESLNVTKRTLGQSFCGRDVVELRFGQGEKKVVLMAGVHPNESLANYVLEGAVNWMLSDEANHLRELATVYVYPMVNPDGRYEGFNRATVQHPSRDANRVWEPQLWADMNEVKAVGEALLELQHVDAFVDFHGWTDDGSPFVFMDFREGYAQHPAWLAMTKFIPELKAIDCDTTNPSTESLAILELHAGLAMTFETQYRKGESADELRQLGANVARGLQKGLAQG